jgi:hypothetical protein
MAPQRAAWPVLAAALALIVIVALVVTLVARGGGSGGIALVPTVTPYLDPVQNAATAQAPLLPQDYAPRGIGPCEFGTNVPSATSGVAEWQWTTTPGVVTCPAPGVTRLYSGGVIAFEGFQKAGFPQIANISMEISFHPAQSQPTGNPSGTPTPLAPRTSLPCLAYGLDSDWQPLQATQAQRGVIFCNDGYFSATNDDGSGSSGGYLDVANHYTLNLDFTLNYDQFAINGSSLALPPQSYTDHPLITNLLFSTLGGMPQGAYVDIQNLVITPASTPPVTPNISGSALAATATAQAPLIPQRYAPNGIGPCATRSQLPGSSGGAIWKWTATPGLVTCPGGGVTRLYSGASISFEGFQKAGFPQVALVTATVSFHPGISHDPLYPEPTLAPSQIPCLSATFSGATSFARDSDGIRFCNNASYTTLQPPEYGQTVGFVNEEPTATSYDLAMGLTLSGSNYALDSQPLAGQQVTHSAIYAVTLSTASDMPAGSYVDIQDFVIMPQQISS